MGKSPLFTVEKTTGYSYNLPSISRIHPHKKGEAFQLPQHALGHHN